MEHGLLVERLRLCYDCDDPIDRDHVCVAVSDDLVRGVLSAMEKTDGLFSG